MMQTERRSRNVPCKVCKGTCKVGSEPCSFCDDAGRPRHWCDACDEPLPLCSCFGRNRIARIETDSESVAESKEK